MKLFLTLFTLAMFSFSCSKSEKKLDNTYLGRWKSTNYFYSVGGPVVFSPPATEADFIEFRIGGTFTSNMDGYAYDSYKMKGNNRATLYNTVTRLSKEIELVMSDGQLTINWLNYDESIGHVFIRPQ